MSDRTRDARGVVLVSGASGGIGEAICRSLHDDGWGLVLGYVSEDRARALARELDAKGVPAVPRPLDMSDPVLAAAQIEGILKGVGRLDGVVFNAGWTHAAPIATANEQDWRRALNVNFRSPVGVVHSCLPAMLSVGSGVFVGITSDAAKVGEANHAAYVAAKAALNGFLKGIVHDYGRRGIRANCVAPGPIDTPMLSEAVDSPERAAQMINRLERLVPMGRRGTPVEVAAVVRMLVSEGQFVAGQHVSVGGGVTMTS